MTWRQTHLWQILPFILAFCRSKKNFLSWVLYMRSCITKNITCSVVSADIWVCTTIAQEKWEALLNLLAVLQIVGSAKRKQIEKNITRFARQLTGTATVHVVLAIASWGQNPYALIVFVKNAIHLYLKNVLVLRTKNGPIAYWNFVYCI